MINVLSEITQTGEQRACHFEFRTLVQYHWHSEDLSYHSYEHYYLNLVKNLKKCNLFRNSFLSCKTWYFSLAGNQETGDFGKALEIPLLEKMDNSSTIWPPERNIGARFYKLLLLCCLKLNHLSWIYIYYSLQLWLMPLPSTQTI